LCGTCVSGPAGGVWKVLADLSRCVKVFRPECSSPAAARAVRLRVAQGPEWRIARWAFLPAARWPRMAAALPLGSRRATLTN
jgi:hypothetical protein